MFLWEITYIGGHKETVYSKFKNLTSVYSEYRQGNVDFNPKFLAIECYLPENYYGENRAGYCMDDKNGNSIRLKTIDVMLDKVLSIKSSEWFTPKEKIEV